LYDIIVNGKQHPIGILKLLWKFFHRMISGFPAQSEQCPVFTPSNCDPQAVQNSSWKECNKQRHDCKYCKNCK